jgi:putative transposase
MARPLRIQYPGAVYHVTSRGNEKKAVYQDDQDRDAFLRTLEHVNKRYHWICHAYCLMDNHYHLVIETPDGNLSLGMRQLNGVYTQLFNKRRERSGHLFQGRYQAILIQKETHLLEVCRYVVLNPVRAGLKKQPGDWEWSSYRADAGEESAHRCLTKDWVLSQFGKTRREAEKEYRKFVQRGIGESLWEEVKGQGILGERKFVEQLGEHLKKHKDIPDIPKSQRYANRPRLEQLFAQSVLQTKAKRNKKIVEAVEKCGYTQREVADHLGLYFTSISRIMKAASDE